MRDEAADWRSLTLLARPLPRSLQRRVLRLAPGRWRAYEAGEWEDALVAVEHGEVEVEGRRGSRYRFRSGDILWLCGLSLRAIRNCGSGPAVLVAVSRNRVGMGEVASFANVSMVPRPDEPPEELDR